MKEFWDYILLLLGQFAGGPGPKENNLIRFGLAAILWAVMLLVAWSRQRHYNLPREKLLAWGFGMGLARELYMFSHVSFQLLGLPTGEVTHLSEPLEHALTMAAIVTVAGAFIRYILDDAHLSRRFLQLGLSTTAVTFVVTWAWWYIYATAHVTSGSTEPCRFNQTWGGVIFFLLTGLFAAVGIFYMSRRHGWLRDVISVALGIFVVIGVLRLVNFATGRTGADLLCRIANSLHILAIPLFGYVYLREQATEKKAAEDALAAHRDHLEELVDARTDALKRANVQLQAEIAERRVAEESVVQRNAELAAQNAIAATVSRSLELDVLLDTALDTVLAVLEMDVGCIGLLDADGSILQPTTIRGRHASSPLVESVSALRCCRQTSQQAVATMQPVLVTGDNIDCEVATRVGTFLETQTVVSTPLVSKGRAVGVLSLCSHRLNAMPAHEVEVLAAIGQQIGVAVENARLYQQTGQWAEELALLHESTTFLTGTLDAHTIYQRLTEQTAKLLGCEAAFMLRWDNENRTTVLAFVYRLQRDTAMPCLTLDGTELLAALLETHRSIAIEDGRSHPLVPPAWCELGGSRALLAVPLWGKERPLAFLLLFDRQESRNWRPDEVVWVESFANPAAIALENADLYSQVERAAVLEERQRIAAEMHDGLAQTLSYVGLKAGYATDLLEAGQVAQVLDEHHAIQAAIQRAAREVRQSIASLQQSSAPRQSLQEILAETVQDLGAGTSPVPALDQRFTDPLFLPPHYTEQIVRIVQEATANARRHAHADHIQVRLEVEGGRLTITVADDGQGFDPTAVSPHGGHFGLQIMRARAARIAGQITLVSQPGGGTQVILTCPADAARENKS